VIVPRQQLGISKSVMKLGGSRESLSSFLPDIVHVVACAEKNGVSSSLANVLAPRLPDCKSKRRNFDEPWVETWLGRSEGTLRQ